MNRCPKCSRQVGPDYIYCDECGAKIIKNNILNYMEAGLSFFAIGFSVIAVIIFCFSSASSPSNDPSVTGLYIIFGIPIGISACLPQIFLPALSGLSLIHKQNYLSILKLVACFISYISMKYIKNEFTTNTDTVKILYYIFIGMIIAIAVLVVINSIVLLIKKKK